MGQAGRGAATGKNKAGGDSLTALATGLLGFNLASPPARPGPLSASSLDDQLKKDAFDQTAATQLIRDAALAERLAAGDQLPQVVQEFSALSTAVATNPALPSDPKKLRKEVQKSLRTVIKELARYNARLASSDQIYSAEKVLRKSASAYLAKNTK